jgi:hypothetical protein
MKKYRLKQWYPSLPKEWRDKRGIVSFNINKNGYEMEGVEGITWIIGVHEFSNKDFWELVEKEEKVCIVGFIAKSEGVILETNIPARLKQNRMPSKETFVSWDKIGKLLFEDYTDEVEVKERKELGGSVKCPIIEDENSK